MDEPRIICDYTIGTKWRGNETYNLRFIDNEGYIKEVHDIISIKIVEYDFPLLKKGLIVDRHTHELGGRGSGDIDSYEYCYTSKGAKNCTKDKILIKRHGENVWYTLREYEECESIWER